MHDRIRYIACHAAYQYQTITSGSSHHCRQFSAHPVGHSCSMHNHRACQASPITNIPQSVHAVEVIVAVISIRLLCLCGVQVLTGQHSTSQPVGPDATDVCCMDSTTYSWRSHTSSPSSCRPYLSYCLLCRYALTQLHSFSNCATNCTLVQSSVCLKTTVTVIGSRQFDLFDKHICCIHA